MTFAHDHRRRLLSASAALVALLTMVLPAVPRASAQGAPDYVRAIEAWRTGRAAELTAEDGWLTLVGLFWLTEGTNAVGSDPALPVALPAGTAPLRIGVFTLKAGTVTFAPARGASVRINDQPATTHVLRPQPGPFDVLSTGTLRMFVIKRGDRYGIRVRDISSAARRSFAGLRAFPTSEAYRVTARFVAHTVPTSILIANVLGQVDPWPSPGYVVFTLGGQEYRLHPVLDGADAKELFFVFRDLTTGHETYPGGRFLYAEMPKNGEVVLDFNKAQSPPCAFTPFATCPLPPKENALPVRIEAGELNPHQ